LIGGLADLPTPCDSGKSTLVEALGRGVGGLGSSDTLLGSERGDTISARGGSDALIGRGGTIGWWAVVPTSSMADPAVTPSTSAD
jgi:hypothetical protein